MEGGRPTGQSINEITTNQNQVYRICGECVSRLALVRYLSQRSNPCTFPNSRTKNLAGKSDGVDLWCIYFLLYLPLG